MNIIQNHAMMFWMLASFVVAALVTWLSIVYATRRNVIDLPGRRRSHAAPTPRGGGMGIVVSVAAGLLAMSWLNPEFASPMRLIVAVLMVAGVGAVDDHRPLPAWLRLLVHLAAAIVWLYPLIHVALFEPDAHAHGLQTTARETMAIAALLVFVCVWSINLHNFMDGIDGILAMQAIFVFAVIAILSARRIDSTHALEGAAWASAVAGFAIFNFPRARVFMGDVGSGAVGLLIAVAIIWQVSMPEAAQASGVIAVSAFLIDASCTLASRMLGGRHWYSAHREHLYQWMVRAGMSHVRVVACYAAWNLLLVLPVLYWIDRRAAMSGDGSFPLAYFAAILVYASGLILWICAKRWCLYKVKSRRIESSIHASA